MIVPGVASRTAAELEVELGEQVRALRLGQGRTQVEVADEASISVSALQGLERGAGSSLHTLVQVARVLGRADWLTAFAPPVTVSPMQMLRDRRRQEAATPQRARGRRTRGEP